MGSPRQHPCSKTGCTGTCHRLVATGQEATMEAMTPGGAAERAAQNRKVDEIMTRVRRAAGHATNTNPDALAADRHWGRKNKIARGRKKS